MVTERFEMRLDEEMLAQVDQWRAKRGDVPSRSEAMRRLVEIGLASEVPSRSVKFSDGEKLILLMLRDFYKHLKVDGEIDPDFIAEVIFGGHFWAPKWELDGVFHDYEDSPEAVREVVDVLDMWMLIERGYEKLSKQEKARLEKEAEPFGTDVRFRGFDGNNESEHMGIARFFIEHMGRWRQFKGRELNSHMPTLDWYSRMYRVFEPMRKMLTGRELNVTQLIEILRESTHPEHRKKGLPS
jgi:hypothetical protein